MSENSNVPSSVSVNIQQLRLNFLKSSLNLLRGRRSFLETTHAVSGSDDVDHVPVLADPNNTPLTAVHQQVDSSVNFLAHLLSLKCSFDAMVANINEKRCEDAETLKNVSKELDSINVNSKRFLALDVDETVLNRLRMEHMKETDGLSKLINQPRAEDDEPIQERLKKAEYDVQKINTARMITQVLTAVFISDREAYPEIMEDRSSFRRNLTITDFIQNWDIGYSD